jgi:hypothetical protein
MDKCMDLECNDSIRLNVQVLWTLYENVYFF